MVKVTMVAFFQENFIPNSPYSSILDIMKPIPVIIIPLRIYNCDDSGLNIFTNPIEFKIPAITIIAPPNMNMLCIFIPNVPSLRTIQQLRLLGRFRLVLVHRRLRGRNGESKSPRHHRRLGLRVRLCG